MASKNTSREDAEVLYSSLCTMLEAYLAGSATVFRVTVDVATPTKDTWGKRFALQVDKGRLLRTTHYDLTEPTGRGPHARKMYHRRWALTTKRNIRAAARWLVHSVEHHEITGLSIVRLK
jgi:hypothetical protein